MFEQLPSVLVRNPGDVTGEALFVVDATSGSLVYVNAAAASTFDLRGEGLATVRIAAVIPELADLSERRFVARIAAAAGPRDCDVAVAALTGDAAGARLVSVRLRPAVPPAGLARERRSERLESLWTLVVRRGFAGDEQVRAILRECVRGIGLEHATVARVEHEELVVEFADIEDRVGERIAIAASLERHAVARLGTFAVLDTQLDREFAGSVGETRSFLTSVFRVGDERWALTFASCRPRADAFDDDDWEYVDAVVEAVSRGIERRASDARIERLAYFDALTSLPNRIALHARLDEALADAERTAGRAAVLFLDIDGFKGVNDTAGHRGGDAVLAEIAQRLRGTLRRDEYIGRLGGDEFAIVIPAVADRPEIESIAQRIGSVLSLPFGVEGYRFSLSASIGVAIYPDDARERDDLLACADAAMYSAKEGGGARIRFRAEPRGRLDASFASRSTHADEACDVDYLLCYQPILDMMTGRVTAAEALIRRVDPEHGLLAPERGWSIAHERAGRLALDRYVLHEATAQARAWNLAGTPLIVHVNLAAFDVAELDALLGDEQLGGDVDHLRIEIASDQFDGPESGRLPRFIDHCAACGIRLVLDGFEGDLARLGGLASLPIDALKLERSLVEAITVSRTTRAIIEGSIVVARSLGWSVIAKGVETTAQYDALAELGSDAVQGFHVGRPMTALEFGAWARERDLHLEPKA